MIWDEQFERAETNDLVAMETLDPNTIRDRIKHLANLDPLDYECRRQDEAKALNIRVSVLDDEVQKLRPAQEDTDTHGFAEPEPWPDPVDGNEQRLRDSR